MKPADRMTIDMALAAWLRDRDEVTVNDARRYLRSVFPATQRPIDNRSVARLLEGFGYMTETPGASLVLSATVYRTPRAAARG